MNRFLQHHRDDVRFEYSCFDRMILNGMIRPFQHTACGGTVRWFLREKRQITCSRAAFARIANDYHDWIDQYAADQHLDILQPQQDTDLLKIEREDLVEPLGHVRFALRGAGEAVLV